MKKVKRIILWSLLILLVFVDVMMTVYLLGYNRYNVAQFGKYSFIIIDEKIDKYNKNDLLIVEKNKNSDIKVGDYVFFYDTKSKENIINYGKVNSTYKVNDKETTYTMSDNFPLSSEYVIGKGETSKVFADLGLVLSILASRWGFLFLIIFPVSILLIYQIYLFIIEINTAKKG